MYKFIPPTVEEGPAGTGSLFFRYRLSRGVSVLKINGEFYEIRFPTQDDIAMAEKFYQGGHEHIVTTQEKAELEAAGYTVITT